MKRFKIFTPNLPSSADYHAVDADHFSINSNAGTAQFYRFAKKEAEKDDLVATADARTSVILLDESAYVFEATLGDLSDPVLDKLAELLGVKELDDDQKVNLSVTIVDA